jgi:hypothetical protein
MSNWFNFHTIVAFIIGVLLSGWVMALVARARSKVAG